MNQLQDICGVPYASNMSRTTVLECVNYTPEDGDIFLATYRKSGTNWTFNILSRILAKGQPLLNQIGTSERHFEIVGVDAIRALPKPRVIPTHFPYQLIPKSPVAKYVYVCRNPKDVCVSNFHHIKTFSSPGVEFESFDDFFEKYFFAGRIAYGDYFDHLKSWYPRRNDPNVLCLTYEYLKKNTREAVLNLASFLGQEYEDYVKDDENMTAVLEASSFEAMSKAYAENFKKAEDSLRKGLLDDGSWSTTGLLKYARWFESLNEDKKSLVKLPNPNCFVRKGKVGGWKEYLTEDQSRKLDRKFQLVSKELGGINLWKDADWMEAGDTEKFAIGNKN